jgi:hypothetical protein
MKRPRPLRCPRCKGARLEVYQRLCNYSAFSGYHYTPSRRSGLRCLDCGRVWRTLANVATIPDTREMNVPGYFQQAEVAARCFTGVVDELRRCGFKVTVESAGEAVVEVVEGATLLIHEEVS